MSVLKRFQVLFSVCCLFCTFTLGAEEISSAAMSLEQKVGQLFMVHTHGTVAGKKRASSLKGFMSGGSFITIGPINWITPIRSLSSAPPCRRWQRCAYSLRPIKKAATFPD